MLLIVAYTKASGRARLFSRLLDMAMLGLLGATVDDAQMTQLSGFTVVERRRFNGGLATFVRLRDTHPGWVG